MFIEPLERISRIQPLGDMKVAPAAKNDINDIFKSIFQDRLNDVYETDNAVAADVRALTTGESDDLHSLGVDIAKAQLSLSLMVQLRNRFIESYNELMRINV